MVFENVSKMIAEQLKVDTAKVTREARLVEDLGADSANVMVLIMDLEDHYNMQVDDNAITSLKTVGDVVEYIEQRQQ
ncbi:MAG: acyl carrier protein [Christensenellales bacterium]